MNKLLTIGLVGAGAWWLLSSTRNSVEEPDNIEIVLEEDPSPDKRTVTQPDRSINTDSAIVRQIGN